MDELYKQLGTLFVIGAGAGVGKDMKDGTKMEPKRMIGRALVNGFTGMAAAGLWLIYPTAPFMAIAGAGAGLVILGEFLILKYLDKWLEKKAS